MSTRVAERTLESILNDNKLSKEHLSPYVKDRYALSSQVSYVVTGGPRTEESPGEEKIRKYLESKGIVHEQERPVVVAEDKGEIHIRYADFFLPKYNLHVEYNGMEGNPEDDKRYERKNKVYEKNGIRHVVLHKRDLESGDYVRVLESAINEGRPTQAHTRYRNTYRQPHKSASRPAYAAIAAGLAMAVLAFI